MQTDQLEHLREKLRMAQDETRNMQAKNEVLERFVENCRNDLKGPWDLMLVKKLRLWI